MWKPKRNFYFTCLPTGKLILRTPVQLTPNRWTAVVNLYHSRCLSALLLKGLKRFACNWIRKCKLGVTSSLSYLLVQAPNESFSHFKIYGNKGWNEDRSAQVTAHSSVYRKPPFVFLLQKDSETVPCHGYHAARLGSNGRLEKTTYRSCFTETNKTKPSWEGKRARSFPW